MLRIVLCLGCEMVIYCIVYDGGPVRGFTLHNIRSYQAYSSGQSTETIFHLANLVGSVSKSRSLRAALAVC